MRAAGAEPCCVLHWHPAGPVSLRGGWAFPGTRGLLAGGRTPCSALPPGLPWPTAPASPPPTAHKAPAPHVPGPLPQPQLLAESPPSAGQEGAGLTSCLKGGSSPFPLGGLSDGPLLCPPRRSHCACWLVLTGFLLDLADGAVARRLDACSALGESPASPPGSLLGCPCSWEACSGLCILTPTGAKLDDFADFTSFGLATALLLQAQGLLDGLLAIVYVLAVFTRLCFFSSGESVRGVLCWGLGAGARVQGPGGGVALGLEPAEPEGGAEVTLYTVGGSLFFFWGGGPVIPARY